jgi:cobaltochelatase CobN
MHLLATQSLSLDEADVAVDLEQTPADVVVLSFSDSDLSALAAAWHARRDALPSLRLASLKRLKHPMSVDLYLDSVIGHARVVIVRALGGLDYWRYGFERIAAVARAKGIVFIALPGDDRPDARLTALSTVAPEVVAKFDSYFRHGGPDNIGNALAFAASLIGREAAYAEPKAVGAASGMLVDGRVAAFSDLASAKDERPAALVVFYRAQLMAADTRPMQALMRSLEDQGLAALAVAVTSLKDPEAGSALEALMGARRPAIILNATAFSSLREDGTSVLDSADVPILQVMLAGSTREAWAASPRGLSPTDIAMNVVLPELDGRIVTRAISFKSVLESDADLEYASVHHEPDVEGIGHVAKLAAAWVRLGKTASAERKLALVLSDYPARAGRAGYAVGLDTAASAAGILNALSDAGYDAGGKVWAGDDFAPLLNRASATLDIPLSRYRSWLDALPSETRETIDAAWGAPEDDPAVSNGSFRIPVLQAGNVLVALQPDRGSEAGHKAGYHDLASPPRHAYVAFYLHLREQQRIYALVHLGTHGTLEWLPGKALALSDACAPQALLGPVPVVYPFIVNNPGEAVQAKRRISAVTIGHLTPPLSEAGLHGPLAELEGLIEEYAEADGVDRRRSVLLEAEIVERAWRSGLAKDCGLLETDTPRAAITKLDAQLCDIKELAIRDRLHVFGCVPDEASRAELARVIAAAGGLSAESEHHLAAQIEASARSELAALLAALDGRRIAPGPAGAPTRGRADVLPTGRNLTTMDPRSIPTRTAAIVGARAASEIVRRYLQDHGDYPKAIVLDLWASASLRTGGDDLAQALSYLGVRPTWDAGSQRVTGVEVIPAPKLERPRIDVTLRISGLFRDIFASQIALFDMAVGLVAGLDEDEAWNPLAAARQRGESLDRVFGAAPGVYGAGVASVALDGAVSDQDAIGAAYLDASTFAYGRGDAAVPAPDQYRRRILASDAHVHVQDDRECDLLSGDGVADFSGGYAAAAALVGKQVSLYHLDTSRTEAPRARTLAEEITRVVRGRLTNPRWIAGMLAHGYRGASEIAQGVDALYAFGVSARIVPSHLFDAVHDALLGDGEVASELQRVNRDAADAIARRLEDAISAGLWTPRRNAVAFELQRMRRGGDDEPTFVEAAQ